MSSCILKLCKWPELDAVRRESGLWELAQIPNLRLEVDQDADEEMQKRALAGWEGIEKFQALFEERGLAYEVKPGGGPVYSGYGMSKWCEEIRAKLPETLKEPFSSCIQPMTGEVTEIFPEHEEVKENDWDGPTWSLGQYLGTDFCHFISTETCARLLGIHNESMTEEVKKAEASLGGDYQGGSKLYEWFLECCRAAVEKGDWIAMGFG